MPVTINGDGSIAGLSVGGLGNGGIVDADSLASNAVTTAKLASGAISASTLPAGTIVQTVFQNGTASSAIVQLNGNTMGNPGWFDTGLRTAISPIFATSKIIVTAMYSIRVGDGNRVGVGIYNANNANMTNLARISDYRGGSGQECFRNNTGGRTWSTHTLFAVDDGSYGGSAGTMSTSARHYNLGFYTAGGDGTNYYGDNSQRVYLLVQEVKQ